MGRWGIRMSTRADDAMCGAHGPGQLACIIRAAGLARLYSTLPPSRTAVQQATELSPTDYGRRPGQPGLHLHVAYRAATGRACTPRPRTMPPICL